jgi:hypothetical protein
VTTISLAAPAAASADSVALQGFTLDKSCVSPGGTVTATVTVQDTDWYQVNFYGQASVSEFGTKVYTAQPVGPYPAPPFVPLTVQNKQQVPTNTPWGYYTINFGIGPSAASPTSWGSRSATLTVSPWCF